MTDDGKGEIADLPLRSRRGFKRYGRNPSVPERGLPNIRKRPVKIPGADTGVQIFDGTTGELMGKGVRSFIQFEEVDAARFVKLYLAGMKQAAGLSPKSGMKVFEIVHKLLQERPNSDQVALSWHSATALGYQMPERTFRHGLRQLLQHEFLFESLVEGNYYINIEFMFNGDRLNFVRSYQLKSPEARSKAGNDDEKQQKDGKDSAQASLF